MLLYIYISTSETNILMSGQKLFLRIKKKNRCGNSLFAVQQLTTIND